MSRTESLVALVRKSISEWNKDRKSNPGQPNLSGANLSGMDLSGADFRGAILSGANLSESTLDGADFRGANVKGVNFMHATFTFHTNILPSQLATTAFRGAKGLSPQLLQATLEAISASCKPKPVQPKKKQAAESGICE